MSNSEQGFSIIDLLVSMAVLAIIAMIVIPQLVMVFDRGRQRRSMADMRNLASALSTYHLDNSGNYPDTGTGLAGLQPDYYSGIPLDGWGNGYLYIGINNGCSYLLTGLGSDGVAGPAAPSPWPDDTFEPDILLVNGTFFAAPGVPTMVGQVPAAIAASCS